MPAIDQPAPDFTATGDGDSQVTLSALRGQKVIVYFYPKDLTPGCTTQACAFRDLLPDFHQANAVVLGVSRDSPARHDKFKAKHDLNFALLADEDGHLCHAYGVWVEKKNYGRSYMGIERSTFLIDEAGVIRQIWRKVRVKGHVEAVLAATRQL